MSVNELYVAGYRSVREIRLPLTRLNVLTGPNGCGKSNLHRALYLLHMAATGRFAPTLAEEGGMPSVLWAGSRKKGPVRLTLRAEFREGIAYEMVCGLPEANDLPGSVRLDPLYPGQETTTAFCLDPLFKEETLAFREGRTAVTLMERGKSGVHLRDNDGRRVSLPMSLARSESVLTQIADPYRFPHLSGLRDRLAGWRFYHAFRTDMAAPLRQPQVGVFTPVLSHDGTDLAAALQTIREIGDADGLDESIRDGLNAKLEIAAEEGRFRLRLRTAGLLRPMEAWELSDGTLRYLCLLAALLSPRPPALLALNEPEMSLHPDLLLPLANRIVDASHTSQIWLATHSRPLAEAISHASGLPSVTLEKVKGETRVALPVTLPE